MEKEKIEITGKENTIEIKEGENIEVRGDKNVIEVDAEKKDVIIKGKDNRIAIKDRFHITKDFLTQKKVVNVIAIILLLLILIGGSWIRLQNLPLLVDSTTGEYIPLALDPFYFLRIAETSVAVGGFNNLSEFDELRGPGFATAWHSEILPNSVVLIWKLAKTFDKDITLRFINVISPVIFFVLGLIVFFFLILVLTKSKWIAIISSLFLSLIPSYLYRTMAGFSDHESIGMFAFFSFLLLYALSLKYLNKEKISKIKMSFFALGVGFLSAFTIACWGGIAKFVFLQTFLGEESKLFIL